VTTSSERIFAGFVVLLLDTLAKMVPGEADDADARIVRRDIARILFEAFTPCDALEAMLAARAVAAHHATMDGYARAAQPGTSDEKSIRLRNTAIAASRSFDAVLRTLEKQRKEPVKAPVETAGTRDRDRKAAAVQPAWPQPKVTRSDLAIQIPELGHTSARGRAALRDSTALTATPRPEMATSQMGRPVVLSGEHPS
jgi:hypothetical protein